jgi:anthranilate synthase/aminodeoxychorismate synthase-like glutamine amidotransferase
MHHFFSRECLQRVTFAKVIEKMNTFSNNILLIDNEDSFTWNIVQLLEQLNCVVNLRHPTNVHNNEIENYNGAIISPGPGLPNETKGLMEFVEAAVGKIPLLGICLGHQAIAMHFGSKLFCMNNILHGKRAKLSLCKTEYPLFKNVKDLHVGLYHSWAIQNHSMPPQLEPIALTNDGIIMAFQHIELPIFGLQFHPESYITTQGKQIVKNWIDILK